MRSGGGNPRFHNNLPILALFRESMKLFKDRKTSSTFDILCKTRNRFNEIYVIENGDHREMWFKGGGNFFLQSRLALDSSISPVLIYSKMMLASLLFQESPKRILMVGLGGGSLSNFLHHHFPKAHIDVVEVDPEVIDLSKKYFRLQETENYQVHAMDARVFIQNQIGKKPYDLVLLDAFKSGSVPFHLKTGEFYQEIRDVLSLEGVVASNLYGKSNSQKPGDRTTFGSVFQRLYFFEDPEQVATVVIATNQKRSRSALDIRSAAEAFEPDFPFSMVDVAVMYRQGLLDQARGKKFVDDFSENDFIKVVEKNNTQQGKNLQYPIKSHS